MITYNSRLSLKILMQVVLSFFFLSNACAEIADIILDDDQAEYVGQWVQGDRGSQYGSGVHIISKKGKKTATWKLSIPVAGHYKVYAYLPGGDDLTTRARYSIQYSVGKETVKIDQREPVGQWQLLGTYEFDTGHKQKIKLSSARSSSATVIADAIKLTYVEAITVDDNQAQYSGRWHEIDWNNSQYGNGLHYIDPDFFGHRPGRATWPLAITTDGDYEVSVRSPAYFLLAKDASFSVYKGTEHTAISIDQTHHDGQWQSLGQFSFKHNEDNRITLDSHRRRYVVADAVRAQLLMPSILAPPSLDLIDSPVNDNPLTIQGTAQLGANVLLYVNAIQQQSVLSDSDTGRFSVSVDLNDGLNEIFARIHRGQQESEDSNHLLIEYINQTPTQYTGSLTEDTVWTADEPVQVYTIYDTLIIEPGVTLTIKPGTQVNFASSAKLIVKGTLDIQGNELQPVLITADPITGQDKQPGDWIGINVTDSGVLHAQYATIEYAENAFTFTQGQGDIAHVLFQYQSEHAIVCINASPNIQHTQLAYSGKSAILLQGDNQSLIENNNITHNQGGGIEIEAISPGLVTTQILKNHINNNQDWAIQVIGNRESGHNPNPVIQQNYLFDNGKNNQYDPSENLLVEQYDDPANTIIQAQNNFWGNTKIVDIRNTIYDYDDNPEHSPKVDISQYWNEQGFILPIANAGSDQTASVSQTVTLDGSASYDPNGNTLSYQWQITAAPTGSLAALAQVQQSHPSFIPDKEGDYIITLSVNNGQLSSEPDSVLIQVSGAQALSANAGIDQLSIIGQSVTLDGRASHYSEEGVLNYHWQIIDSPQFSKVQLLANHSSQPMLIPDKAGQYELELTVSVGNLQATDRVLVTTQNQPPIAHAGYHEQFAVIGQDVLLSGHRSSDPDGDVLMYNWVLQRPSSSAATLTDPQLQQAHFIPDVVGTYEAQLIVNDGLSNSATATQLITVTTPGSSIQTTELASGYVLLPYRFTLQMAENESGLSFALAQSPPGMTIDVHTGTLSWTPLVQGSYGVTVKVTNTAGGVSWGFYELLIQPANEVLPADPQTLIQATLGTGTIPIHERVAFLYTGSHPIQSGVAAHAIDTEILTVIRGQIFDKKNNPLAGVLIQVKEHPEFGQTLTRADGWFDLVVNGGIPLVLTIKKEGYLNLQRSVEPKSNSFSVLPNIVLLPYSPEVTRVDLTDSSQPFYLVKGESIHRADTEIQTHLIISQGTRATMTLPDNSQQILDQVHIRVTQYSVDEQGRQVLPAQLPDTVGHTYAVELSLDEAISVGAHQVEFSQPISLNVDNYLQLPIGTLVPSGWYDSQLSQWQNASSGRIIGVLSISDTKAQLDIDGSGVAADAATLSALGITPVEQQALAQLYSVGSSFWRVTVNHFTPWYIGWPWRLSPDMQAPTNPAPEKIHDASPIVHDISLEGAPFYLHYSSEYSKGAAYQRFVDIPLTGASLPEGLLRVELSIRIAGQLHQQSFPAAIDQTHRFEWDGNDAYGQVIHSPRQADIDVTYVYQEDYHSVSGTASEQVVRMRQHSTVMLGTYSHTSAGLGGFSASVHHSYDPGTQTVLMGSGEQYTAQNRIRLISDIVAPESVTRGPDSTLYVASSDRISHIDNEGHISTVLMASLVTDIAFSPSGLLHFCENGRFIRQVQSDGSILTIAGTGGLGFSGDGAPAIDASIHCSSIAFNTAGELFFSQPSAHRIRKIDVSGIISTVAGIGDEGFSGDGGNALEAMLRAPDGLTVAADGSLYIADANDAGAGIIRKVDPTGIIKTIAGGNLPNIDSSTPSGLFYMDNQGKAARDAWLSPSIHDLSVGPRGALFFGNGNYHCALKIGTDQTVTQLTKACHIPVGVAHDFSGLILSDMVAIEAEVGLIRSVALSVNGEITLADSLSNQLYQISSISLDDKKQYLIHSSDGTEQYIFDQHGRHLQTRDIDSDTAIYDFTYDANGYLSSIIDAGSHVYDFIRNLDGLLTQIKIPAQGSTAAYDINVVLDENGYLAQLIIDGVSIYNLSWSVKGLLTVFDVHGGSSTNHYYTGSGLKRDTPPNTGGHVGDDIVKILSDKLLDPGDTSLVGSIPGQFISDASGAANYSIPITIAPGTAGVEPKLSVNYNSQAGNGLLGVGWSLGGLSAIHRCAQTYAQDGKRTGVNFSRDDRICLDGQRLIPVGPSSAYTEYRTESNSFSKIVGFSFAGGDHQYFKIWTKSGEILEYGMSPDARVLAHEAHWYDSSEPVIQKWALNKVSDTLGNFYTITYQQDDKAPGQQNVSHIDYTGNTRAGTTPYARVEFHYEERPDDSVGFLAGSRIENHLRLSTISSTNKGVLVRKYRFKYYDENFDSNYTNTFTRLAQIRSCVDVDEMQCVAPTNIQWHTYTAGYDEPVVKSLTNKDLLHTTRVLDFNGDGIDDLFSENKYVTLYNRAGDIEQTITLASVPSGLHQYYLMDYDGDGSTDIIQFDSDLSGAPSPNTYYVYRYNLPRLSASLGYTRLNVAGMTVLDINGDGLQDIFSSGHSLINTGHGFELSDVSPSLSLAYEFSDFNPALGPYTILDANGDGMQDLLGRSYLLLGSSDVGVRYFDSYVTPYTEDSRYSPMDLNADGYQDLISFNANSLSYRLNKGAVGSGVSFSAPTVARLVDGVTGSNIPAYKVDYEHGEEPIKYVTLDYNNDGLYDFLVERRHSKDSPMPHYWIYIAVRESDAGVSFKAYETQIPLTPQAPLIGDFNGDGLSDLMYYASDHWNLRLRKGQRGDLVSQIIAGYSMFDDLITINYKPLTDEGVYRKGALSEEEKSRGIRSFQGPVYVVSDVQSDNGIGGMNRKHYFYSDSKIDVKGRGRLGFASRQIEDETSGLMQLITYRQDFPFIAQVESKKSYFYERLLSEQTNLFDYKQWGEIGHGRGIVFPYVKTSIATTYDLNTIDAVDPNKGQWINSVVTQNSYRDDDFNYGNVYQVRVTTVDDTGTYEKISTNEYDNITAPFDFNDDVFSRWQLGRLKSSTVTHLGGQFGDTEITRNSHFTYDAETGLLNSETIEEGVDALTTTYQHDIFGNRIQSTVSGAAIAPRTTKTRYDVDGRYPTQSENALGHVETYQYEDKLGKRTRLQGPNGLVTQWEYDSLSRLTKEIRADNTTTQIDRFWCYGDCYYSDPDNNNSALYLAITSITGGAQHIDYYDKKDRVITSQDISFNGHFIYSTVRFDALGRKQTEYAPYFEGDNNGISHYQYDVLDRPILVDSPVDGVTSISYVGLSVTTSNAKNQVSVEIQNSLGHTLATQDAKKQWLLLDYDATGNQTRSTDAAGNQIIHTYNARGEKQSTYDPDMGLWSYHYNVLGELVWQEDAKGQKVLMEYDLLGRMVKRYQHCSGCTPEAQHIETWAYDQLPAIEQTAGYAPRIGKLLKEHGPEGFSRETRYDDLLRVQMTQTQVAGERYTILRDYDEFSRVATTTYPVDPVTGLSIRVRNEYNSWGYLAKVLNDESHVVYWQGDQSNAAGAFIEQHYGDYPVRHRYHPTTRRLQSINSGDGFVQDLAYQFDRLGNLTQRQDKRVGQTGSPVETFEYDALNRLSRVNTVLSGIDHTQSIAYDRLGNILQKDSKDYLYDPLHPHAVKQAGALSYFYDLNGNLEEDSSGRLFEWSYYNKPVKITRGSTEVQFTYGPDRARYQKRWTNGTRLEITTYIGGLYERIKTDLQIRHRYFIKVAGQTVAIEEIKCGDCSDPQRSIQWHFGDHLGSVDTIVTRDHKGGSDVITYQSYDAFGLRRQSSWHMPGASAIISNEPRGFTGHEHLDDLDLIHMNGRIYDPQLGRFLSADPYIQFPKNMQSYNRYSYVLNNPLSLTDPTGFFSFGDVVRVAVGVVIAYVSGGVASGVVTGMQTGAATSAIYGVAYGATAATLGGVASMAMGGTYADGLQDALLSGLMAGTFKFIGGSFYLGGVEEDIGLGRGVTVERIVAHGLVGGTVARINGGQFAEGFISGAFTKSVSSFISNPVTAAVVGGTASELVGGKFANGALSGAFGYAYNSMEHDQKYSDIQNATPIPGAEDQYDMPTGQIAGYAALFVVFPEMLFSRIGAYFGASRLGAYGAKSGVKNLKPTIIQENPRNLIPTQLKSDLTGSQVKRLTKSMKKNGFDQTKPVDAWRNPKTGRLELQDGHHRTEAAKKAGLDKIPVQVWE